MAEFLIPVTLCFFCPSFSFHFFLLIYQSNHHHFRDQLVYPHPMMQKLLPDLLICFLKFFSICLLASIYFILNLLFWLFSFFSSILREVIHSTRYYPSTKKPVSLRPQIIPKINRYDLFIFCALISCPFVFYASFKTFICAFYV